MATLPITSYRIKIRKHPRTLARKEGDDVDTDCQSTLPPKNMSLSGQQNASNESLQSVAIHYQLPVWVLNLPCWRNNMPINWNFMRTVGFDIAQARQLIDETMVKVQDLHQDLVPIFCKVEVDNNELNAALHERYNSGPQECHEPQF